MVRPEAHPLIFSDAFKARCACASAPRLRREVASSSNGVTVRYSLVTGVLPDKYMLVFIYFISYREVTKKRSEMNVTFAP